MRVFVTGWDGLLGHDLVPRLSRSHEVDGFGVGDGDIADRGFLRTRLDAFEPQVIVHLAAMTAVDRCENEVDEAFRVNAEGARLVAAEAERLGVAVIALSTDYVFDGRKTSPYEESDSPRPLSVYGRSKLAGEEAVREAATRWAVVRSAWLYGRGGRNFLETILDLLEQRETVSVVADQIGSPTHTLDLADALARLVESDPRGVYHLVNGGQASWYDLAREGARLAGSDPDRVRPTTTAEFHRPAPRPAFSVLANLRGRERHRIELKSWNEALREYMALRPSEGEEA